MITHDQIQHDLPYWCRVKRSNRLAVVTVYGEGRVIERVKGTDPNCFLQQLNDYDFIAPAIPSAEVLDELTTLKLNRLEPRAGG